MNTYPLKAALHFLAAFCATIVAAGANEPHTTWQWVLLVTGALGAGSVALKGYLSDATNQPPNTSARASASLDRGSTREDAGRGNYGDYHYDAKGGLTITPRTTIVEIDRRGAK